MGALAALISVAPLAQPAAAQLQQDPLTANPHSGDGGELFGNTGNAGISSMFDLIHQAQLGLGRSLSDFSRSQETVINTEAASFLEQRRLLLEQNQSTQTAPGAILAPTDLAPVEPGQP